MHVKHLACAPQPRKCVTHRLPFWCTRRPLLPQIHTHSFTHSTLRHTQTGTHSDTHTHRNTLRYTETLLGPLCTVCISFLWLLVLNETLTALTADPARRAHPLNRCRQASNDTEVRSSYEESEASKLLFRVGLGVRGNIIRGYPCPRRILCTH